MLELKNISKSFHNRIILDEISIKFNDTGFVGIQGESGCGKSTLLYTIGMLDNDHQGEVIYNGIVITKRNEYIRNNISYMMQSKDIISSLNVKENILLACQVSNIAYQQSLFTKIVTQLEIDKLLEAFPHQLSGGQLKRVSIAKALLKQSPIVLCDEPTGALHQKQAHEVMKLLKTLAKSSLVIIVSHDKELLKQYCDSVLTIHNKKLKGRIKKQKPFQYQSIKKTRYSLWFYTIRQLMYQKNKLFFLFVFQWIVIIAFFLVTTAINGIFNAIERSEKESVNVNMIQVENRNGNQFTKTIQFANTSDVDYAYHLDQIYMKSNNQEVKGLIQFMPQQDNHICLSKGYLPQNKNEVLISSKLYKQLKKKDNLSFFVGDKELSMKVVGVLKASFFDGDEVYCSRLLKNDLKELKNQYLLMVEAVSNQSRELYQSLNNSYYAYSDVLERVDNYQSLLSLAKMVAYVFIGISFVISLLLIAIVESIIYFERQHDIAYLLSLGLSKQRLLSMALKESSLLGIIMAFGGCLLSKIIYYYINEVYMLKLHFSFELTIKPILFSSYDLYLLIFLSYLIMCVVATIIPIMKMMKTDMIDVLREE